MRLDGIDLDAVRQTLAGLDPARVPAADLGRLADELQAVSAAADAALVRTAGQADRARVWESDGFRGPAGWVAARTRLTRPAAAGVANAARRLVHVPQLADAFRQGDVGLDHVVAVTGALTTKARCEQAGGRPDTIFTVLARQADAQVVRRAVTHWLEQADPDGIAKDEQAAYQARGFHASPSWKGNTYLNGQLHPEGGETLLAALRAAIGGPPGPDDDRTAAQRRADALIDIARFYLDTAATGVQGGERPQVTATVDLPSLLGWHDHHRQTGQTGPTAPGSGDDAGVPPPADPDRAAAPAGHVAGAAPTGAGADDGAPIPDRLWAGNGYGFGLTAALPLTGPISRQTALRLLCDAGVSRLITDGKSEILDLGRAVRTATDAQKKALAWRDGGCVYPGCDRPPWHCDAHHLRNWVEHRGSTDVDELVLTCRYHHRRLHEGGEILHRTEDGDLYLITRTGTRPAGQRSPAARAP
jgi:Domain of unknown function (DUF222)